MSLFDKLLEIKHLKLDDEVVIKTIIDFMQLHDDYRFELNESLLMNFCWERHIKFMSPANYMSLNGFISNHKLLVVFTIFDTDDGDIEQSLKYFIGNKAEITIENIEKIMKLLKYGDHTFVNVCDEVMDIYEGELTFASLLPQMCKSARN